MRLVLLALAVCGTRSFATTVDELQASVSRLSAQPDAGRSDEALTQQLKILETKLGIALPIDPAAARKGEPKTGSASWGDSFFTDQGPTRPHLINGTLVTSRSASLASVGGSLLVINGSASLGFVIDSIVIASKDVRIARLINSVVVIGGDAAVSHLEGSTVLAQRIELSSVQHRSSKQPCVVGASVGLRVRWLGASCTAINTPAQWVRAAAADAQVISKSDPSLSKAHSVVSVKPSLSVAPACSAALVLGEKPLETAVGVTSVPWRTQRGVVPPELEHTRVLDVYDSAVALDRAGEVILAKAAPAPVDAKALRAPELFELGGEVELHGIGFSQPGQLEPTLVRVTGEQPKVLVLSSGEGTRWRIEVTTASALRAVVLLGGSRQHVQFTGSSAPVVLDIDEWPCGRGFDGLRWTADDGPERERQVIARVLQLLGRKAPSTFTSVQRGVAHTTGSTGAPSYVVGPVSK